MAFNIRDLSVLNYAQGYTQFMIRTTDSIEEACQPDWAHHMHDLMKHNDTVHIQTPAGTGIRCVSNVAGVLTFVPML